MKNKVQNLFQKIKTFLQNSDIKEWAAKLKDPQVYKDFISRFKNKKFRNRFMLVTGAVILVLAACFTLFISPLRNKDQYIYKEETVQQGNLVQGVSESGSLDLNAKDISYEVVLEDDDSDDDSDDSDSSDDDSDEEDHYLSLEEVYVASGSRVSEGDNLMRFTTDSVESVKNQLNSIKTEAEVTLAEAQAEYNISLITAKSTSDISKIESQYADSTYQAKTSYLTNEVKKAQEDITVLQGEIEGLKEDLADGDLWSSYKEAKKALASAQSLWEATSVHDPAAYNANYASYTKAKQTFDQLQDKVDQLNESIDSKQKEVLTKQTELSEKQSQLSGETLTASQNQETSSLSGETADAIYGYTADSLKESVETAQNAVDEAEENLQTFTDFVSDDGYVCAPADAVITQINYEAGDQLLETGVVLSYATGEKDTVTVDVSEEDIPYITVGDAVDIVFTAYPDETYEGIVTGIESKVTDDHASTVNYPVTVLVQGDTDQLYSQMTADVTFARDSVKDVLYVSKKAIVEQDDGTECVYIKQNGKMKLTTVVTGFSNGMYVEIKEGLEKDETIYIASKVSADNSKTIEAEESSTQESSTQENNVQQNNMQQGNPQMMSMPEMQN